MVGMRKNVKWCWKLRDTASSKHFENMQNNFFSLFLAFFTTIFSCCCCCFDKLWFYTLAYKQQSQSVSLIRSKCLFIEGKSSITFLTVTVCVCVFIIFVAKKVHSREFLFFPFFCCSFSSLRISSFSTESSSWLLWQHKKLNVCEYIKGKHSYITYIKNVYSDFTLRLAANE